MDACTLSPSLALLLSAFHFLLSLSLSMYSVRYSLSLVLLFYVCLSFFVFGSNFVLLLLFFLILSSLFLHFYFLFILSFLLFYSIFIRKSCSAQIEPIIITSFPSVIFISVLSCILITVSHLLLLLESHAMELLECTLLSSFLSLSPSFRHVMKPFSCLLLPFFIFFAFIHHRYWCCYYCHCTHKFYYCLLFWSPSYLFIY